MYVKLLLPEQYQKPDSEYVVAHHQGFSHCDNDRLSPFEAACPTCGEELKYDHIYAGSHGMYGRVGHDCDLPTLGVTWAND